MANPKLNTIFQSIKSSLSQDKQQGGSTDILKMEPGNTYTVRLLPSKDPAKTFFHHYQHGWMSYSTGKYVGALSLQTFKERDPIAEARFKLLKTGTAAEQEKAKTIRRAEKWLINVYVISDPTNPENNGKNKILRYGKQLESIISSAIKGDGEGDADALGSRVFDLGPDGVNLKIKVTKQGEFPSFVESKFTMPTTLADVDEDKAEKVYGGVFELDKIIPVKSEEELVALYEEHFIAKSAIKPATQEAAPLKERKVTNVDVGDDNDAEVKALLDGLDVT